MEQVSVMERVVTGRGRGDAGGVVSVMTRQHSRGGSAGTPGDGPEVGSRRFVARSAYRWAGGMRRWRGQRGREGGGEGGKGSGMRAWGLGHVGVRVPSARRG